MEKNGRGRIVQRFSIEQFYLTNKIEKVEKLHVYNEPNLTKIPIS
jgi:hypothetical protein